MKKITALMLCLCMAILLSSCGENNTEEREPETTTKTAVVTPVEEDTVPEQSELFDAYLKANYPDDVCPGIFDYNDDGDAELIVISNSYDENNYAYSFNLEYFTESAGRVVLKDSFSYSTNDSAIPYSGDMHGRADIRVTPKAILIDLCYGEDDKKVSNIFVFTVENDAVKIKVHLLDPGHENGEGIYDYNRYINSQGEDPVFYMDNNGATKGEYGSYYDAVNSLLNIYGFSMERSNEDNKFHAQATEGGFHTFYY